MLIIEKILKIVMDHSLQGKVNIEGHVWLLSSTFKNCKDQVVKKANYNQPASANSSDEELRLFSNCVTKSLKAVALFPASIN